MSVLWQPCAQQVLSVCFSPRISATWCPVSHWTDTTLPLVHHQQEKVRPSSATDWHGNNTADVPSCLVD
jgi:hypothetical protein